MRPLWSDTCRVASVPESRLGINRRTSITESKHALARVRAFLLSHIRPSTKEGVSGGITALGVTGTMELEH